jgi:NADPH:quinone reductase-like Zn-dependent oxidoreductase
MKAVVLNKYGSPDNLELKGIPMANRFTFGLLQPKSRILGCDVSGQVVMVGSKVKDLQTGDEIFGDISGCGMGAFAEYVCASVNVLALKPKGLTFEEAEAFRY